MYYRPQCLICAQKISEAALKDRYEYVKIGGAKVSNIRYANDIMLILIVSSEDLQTLVTS